MYKLLTDCICVQLKLKAHQDKIPPLPPRLMRVSATVKKNNLGQD